MLFRFEGLTMNAVRFPGPIARTGGQVGIDILGDRPQRAPERVRDGRAALVEAPLDDIPAMRGVTPLVRSELAERIAHNRLLAALDQSRDDTRREAFVQC